MFDLFAFFSIEEKWSCLYTMYQVEKPSTVLYQSAVHSMIIVDEDDDTLYTSRRQCEADQEPGVSQRLLFY